MSSQIFFFNLKIMRRDEFFTFRRDCVISYDGVGLDKLIPKLHECFLFICYVVKLMEQLTLISSTNWNKTTRVSNSRNVIKQSIVHQASHPLSKLFNPFLIVFIITVLIPFHSSNRLIGSTMVVLSNRCFRY